MLHHILNQLRKHWINLVTTFLLFQLVSYILLTPAAAVVMRLFIAFTGNIVIANEEIARFLLQPLGIATVVVMGAIAVSIFAIQQAALLIVLELDRPQHYPVVFVLETVSGFIWSLLQVTLRMMLTLLLWSLPVLIIAGVTYLSLLTSHDINYYLSEKPPEFVLAVVVGICCLVTLLVIGAYLFSSWFFALPIILFTDVSPANVLKESKVITGRHRKIIVGVYLCWLLFTSLGSAAILFLIDLFGDLLLRSTYHSISLLPMSLVIVLLLYIFANFILSFLSAATLVLLIDTLFRKYNGIPVIELANRTEQNNTSSAGIFRLTRWRVISIIIIGCLIATFSSYAIIESAHQLDHAEITGHRGAAAVAPENTLAAIRRAILDQADWVEIDVQENAEGEVVVIHDSDLKKIAGRDLKIWDATSEDLKQIDIGSWFAPEFHAERVPTLREVLKLCKDKIGVNIELKYYGHDVELEQKVVELVEAEQMADQIVIMSLKADGIKKIRNLRPDWKIGFLTATALGDVTEMDVDFLAVNLNMATRKFVRNAKLAGKTVHVWTANDPLTISTMFSRGVDNIITDDPALARRVKQQRAELSDVQRLLLEAAIFLQREHGKILSLEDF